MDRQIYANLLRQTWVKLLMKKTPLAEAKDITLAKRGEVPADIAEEIIDGWIKRAEEKTNG